MTAVRLGVLWGGLSAVSACAFDSTPLTPAITRAQASLDAAVLVLHYDAEVRAPHVTVAIDPPIDAAMSDAQTAVQANPTPEAALPDPPMTAKPDAAVAMSPVIDAPKTLTDAATPAVDARRSMVCPHGDGQYCGGHGIEATQSILYQCSAGSWTVRTVCEFGCEALDEGGRDQCTLTPSCPRGDCMAPQNQGSPPTQPPPGAPPPPLGQSPPR